MIGDRLVLDYNFDSLSMHTILRVTDPDSGVTTEVMFDNLTTVAYLMVEHGLKARQEFVGFAATPGDEVLQEFTGGGPLDGTKVMVNDWRSTASGNTDEVLNVECVVIVECVGDSTFLSSEDMA
jgi:hypothetical protein